MLEQFEKQSTPEVLSYVSYIYMANGSSCTKSQKHLLAFNLWTRILSAVILQVNQVKDKDASWKRNTMHTCRRKLSWLIDARYLFPLLFLLFIVFAKLLDLFRSKLAEKWVDLAVWPFSIWFCEVHNCECVTSCHNTVRKLSLLMDGFQITILLGFDLSC